MFYLYTPQEAAEGIISIAKIVSQFLALTSRASWASSKTPFVIEVVVVVVVVVIRSILFPSFQRKGFERALQRHVAREMHSEILKIYFPPDATHASILFPDWYFYPWPTSSPGRGAPVHYYRPLA